MHIEQLDTTKNIMCKWNGKIAHSYAVINTLSLMPVLSDTKCERETTTWAINFIMIYL